MVGCVKKRVGIDKEWDKWSVNGDTGSLINDRFPTNWKDL